MGISKQCRRPAWLCLRQQMQRSVLGLKNGLASVHGTQEGQLDYW